ncbi:MAG: hypothetical protein ACREDM_02490, partial [Methylocella sp.]
MKRSVSSIPSPLKTLIFPVAGLALILLLDGPLRPAWAQSTKKDNSTETPAFAPAAIEHARKMRAYKDAGSAAQATPHVIPKFSTDADPSGLIASFQPGGATVTAKNPFFQNLGTNGRTCFTCHQPQEGWSITPAGVQARFNASGGTDPLFRLVDGATCPTDDVSTLAARREAYKLVIAKGLIRIGLPLPVPPNLQFEVTKVDDPYNCTTNPSTGLTSPTAGIVSVYRRVLPSTNLGFLSAILSDGREPSLEHQFMDATLIHAQATTAPTPGQQQEAVAFDTGIFTAQKWDNEAHGLHAHNGTGGPVALSRQLAKFFIGVNDPFGMNPTGAPFDRYIFDLYKYWQGLRGEDIETLARESVARGEEIFNTTKIKITGVAGINDVLKLTTFNGFCGTCHDTPNIGKFSVPTFMNIGIADAGAKSRPALDVSGLPVFTLKCTKGPLAGQTFVVTDPGRALISGQCADIGIADAGAKSRPALDVSGLPVFTLKCTKGPLA